MRSRFWRMSAVHAQKTSPIYRLTFRPNRRAVQDGHAHFLNASRISHTQRKLRCAVRSVARLVRKAGCIPNFLRCCTYTVWLLPPIESDRRQLHEAVTNIEAAEGARLTLEAVAHDNQNITQWCVHCRPAYPLAASASFIHHVCILVMLNHHRCISCVQAKYHSCARKTTLRLPLTSI